MADRMTGSDKVVVAAGVEQHGGTTAALHMTHDPIGVGRQQL
jgi:hypothetical protein